MTSQKDQIQALIADIDGVLQKTTPRLPWVMSGEVTQQRQMLERVRNYLVAQQRRSAIQEGGQRGGRPDLLAHDIYYQSPQASHAAEPPNVEQRETVAQQMLERVIQEMGYLRANLMQPLQAELEGLHQQRDYLRHEVQQLEAQRQGYGAAQSQATQQKMIAEFLHILTGRLQETLSQQVAQTLKNADSRSPAAEENSLLAVSDAALAPSALYYQTLGQAQQSPSDHLVVNLDSTLKLVFEALERNVQAYQESLTQGLERMHNLGQQGEVMFTGLVNHLAQQLGRETSAALQASEQKGDADATPVPAGQLPSSSLSERPQATSERSQATPDQGLSTFQLPYPGAELPSQSVSGPSPKAVEPLPEASIDAAIDAWLRSAEIPENPSLKTLESPKPEVPDLDTPSLFASLEEEDTEQIDAALKLLEQFGSELPEELAEMSLEETEAEIDRMLSSTSLVETNSEADQIFNDAQNELDEFYELFGKDAVPADLVEDSDLADTWQVSAAPLEATAPAIAEPRAELLPFPGTKTTIAADLNPADLNPA
ncbi:MAG: hypothetical protein WCA35_02215, partial [Kovacikia sp.]